MSTDRNHFIKKNWILPLEQSNNAAIDAGIKTPVLGDEINEFRILLSSHQFIEMLSALEQGAKITHPDKAHEITDRFLQMALVEPPEYVGDGTYYPPYASFVEWLPVSPYRTDLDQTPDPNQYYPAWNVYQFELPAIVNAVLQWFGSSLETITGYKTGDAYSLVYNMAMPDITDQIADWLFGGNGENILETGFNLHLRGKGTLQVELLSVPLGGNVIYAIDREPNVIDYIQGIFDPNDDILDTERDLISFPPELDAESLEEITISDDGDHIIYFRLLPRLNDTLIPISWGAGLRSIRLGEGLTPLDYETNEEISTGDNNQNLGVITVSEAELYNALIRYETEKANRWLFASDVSNILGDVEIDKDTGEVSVKSIQAGSSSGVDASTQQRNNGGAYFQAVKLKKVLDDINTYNTAPQNYSEGVIQGLTAVFVNAVDAARAVWDGFISGYVGYLVTPNDPIEIDTSALAEKIYCKGFDAGLIAYLTENHSEDELSQVLELRQSIPQQTINQWFNEGRANPLDDYVGYECSQLPTQQIIYTLDNFKNQDLLSLTVSGWNFASDRRVQIVVSGNFYDTTDSGNYIDLLYYKASGNPNPLTASWAQRRLYSGLSLELPLTPVVTLPFNSNGTYSFIKTISDGSYGSLQLQQNATAQDGWRANAAGQITLKITDLGAIE